MFEALLCGDHHDNEIFFLVGGGGCYKKNIAAHTITLVTLRVGGTNSKLSLFRNVFMHNDEVNFLRGERVKIM
jgi:hypothetical protein